MHFRTLTPGSYTVAVDQLDGLYLGNQPVYLRDRNAGILHDLKTAPYTFSTAAGAFSDRFEILYAAGVLWDAGTVTKPAMVSVYRDGEKVMVDAHKSVLSRIEVYDLNGRLVKHSKTSMTQRPR
ncbi:MAG: hypothetical protein I8H68_08360 [Flavobacteriia bacterium]|nr:hypothetical protein [Flavobacteriia bacterium]MBH2023809.1 hypothetical protein [Flavobacteriales bacterium]